jgi:hypothetical protein
MRLLVIGGGRFGTYHARQLLRAGQEGAVVTVVDRDPSCRAFAELGDRIEPVVADWLSYLKVWLPRAAASDRLVPAPLAPHLAWEWLGWTAGMVEGHSPRGWGLPYEEPGAHGELFLSAAAWTCPATCVEPSHCPALHAPRDWDLADLIEARAHELGYTPAILRCLHFDNGVGTVAASDLQAAAVAASKARAPGVLVATSSRCHAAVGVLQPGEPR